ncbi:aminoacyl--tRNA ligase-related protein [Streptomyces avicenniae]|uniref:aminoacyl--tRNA ligase-related protein n=1 Tax=Streptomyces avicenniae TaxID=500153 RepID=UPI00069B429C|nr:aminoacyl--tRNA ligase-related protein [Streptomyces avicenniae]
MTTEARETLPVPTAVPGVALFPAEFERVVTRLRADIEKMAEAEDFTVLTAPQVLPRDVVERSGYVREFPNLLGSVHNYGGDATAWLSRRAEAVPGGMWHDDQKIADVVLTPAACYHTYPLLAGTTVTAPARFAVEACCYRHEASTEPGRLRSFRMRELVYVGTEDACVEFRDRWQQTVADWLTGLGLDVAVEAANDPFFGPGAKLLSVNQRAQELKFELVAPVADGLRQAVASANCHKDHFGETFGIELPDGSPAHSTCVAFGLERIALAVVHANRDGGPEDESYA